MITIQGKQYSDDEFIGADVLAAWMGKSPATIKADVARKPDSLPPATYLPGSNRPRWCVKTVADWLDRWAPVL